MDVISVTSTAPIAITTSSSRLLPRNQRYNLRARMSGKTLGMPYPLLILRMY